MTDFAAKYADLEVRWCALAAADAHIYVPNPTPAGPVDYILVAMEPSPGDDDLSAQVAGGFRGFLRSQEDFILHWCVLRYLCRPGQTYHITDISKGAMLPKDANLDRPQRWERWWPSLAAEIALLSRPDGATKIIAVGRDVEEFLRSHSCKLTLTVLHFSPTASGWRSLAIQGREDAFGEFASWLTWDRIVSEAAMPAMTEARVPDLMQRRTLERLPNYLTLSKKKLAFAYRMAFTGIAHDADYAEETARLRQEVRRLRFEEENRQELPRNAQAQVKVAAADRLEPRRDVAPPRPDVASQSYRGRTTMPKSWLKILGMGASGKPLRNDWTEYENGLLERKVMYPRQPGVERGDRIVYYAAGWGLIFAEGEATSDPYREHSDKHGQYPWWVNIHLDLRRPFVREGIPLDAISVGERDLRKSVRQAMHIKLSPKEYEAAIRALGGS